MPRSNRITLRGVYRVTKLALLGRSLNSPFKCLGRSPEFLPQIAGAFKSFKYCFDVQIFGQQLGFDFFRAYGSRNRRAAERPKE